MHTPFTKDKRALLTLDDWRQFSGPKSADHWVDDRSAKELARAWLAAGINLPTEVATLLDAHPRFGAVWSWTAEPEAKLRFDSFAGEPRNSDLVVDAHDAFGPYLIAVEGKADESYGEVVAKTLGAAAHRLSENSRSNGVRRVEQLVEALFGVRLGENNALLALRYQLLTACAGAVCEAERRGYSRVIMLVHEFITDKTVDPNHSRNADDLRKYLLALSPTTNIKPGSSFLYGPFPVVQGALFKGTVELFVGKVSRNLRVGA